MSDASTAPDAEMTRAILADADAQAQKILEQANTAADAERAKAREEAVAQCAEIRASAADKAARLRARALAVATVEKRRLLLTARETAAKQVFAEINSALAAIRSDDALYGESLAALLTEAVRGIGGESVRVTFHESDRGLAAALAPPTAMIDYTLTDDRGGCVALSEDGHVTFNNTYTRRLERMERAIRASIMREVAINYE